MQIKLFIYWFIFAYLLLTGRSSSQENPQNAIHSVTFSVNENSRDAFFNYVVSFSKENKFQSYVYPTTPDGSYFTMELHRSDMKIIGGNTMGIDPKENVSLAIYDDLKSPTSHLNIEEIFSNFVQKAGKISGVSVVRRN